MSYEKKILQMKQMLKKKKQEDTKKEQYKKPEEPFYTESWQQAGLKKITNDYGIVFVKETYYPLSYKHGHFTLEMFYDALDLWHETDNEHPIRLSEEEAIIFYDTETTGLKGVGTQIFLNGLLTRTDEGFILKQYILANPSHEVAFLFESGFWQGEKTVITYNGKSFDWPQLQTRWTLNRQYLPPLKTPRQIDLLHGSKRIWKNDLSRMKLTQVEEEKLGFQRVDDVPGYLAPIIYLDAVRSGQVEALLKVLEHNESDLLSLITLYTQATFLLCKPLEEGSAITYTNIGKWYADLKVPEQSIAFLEGVIDQYGVHEVGEAYYYLAFQRKKTKKFQEAVSYFEKSVDYIDERKKLEALIQLAKLYEHQMKNVEVAIELTSQAFLLTKNTTIYKAATKERKLKEILKRLQRLQRKNG